MKHLVFRFDVDTHKCIKDGVPNLLKLAQELDIKFTFFVNLGKSIDKRRVLMARFIGKDKNIKNLPSLYKLGLKDFLYLLFFNPVIGEKYRKNINRIIKNGHELGLHGGKNHQSWFSEASLWPDGKVHDELSWGLKVFKKINKNYKISAFASPGWNSPKALSRILSEFGFFYLADTHTNKAYEKIDRSSGLKNIPTNILGEPGGVGYIEHCRASGMNDIEIIKDFKRKLKKRRKLAVLYDHPYFVGVKELGLIKQMIEVGISMGYKISTMGEVAKL